MRITERVYSPSVAFRLLKEGAPPVLAKLYAARGIRALREVRAGIDALLPHEELSGAQEAAELLASAIEDQRRILIVSDYDADGATACAIGLRALRKFGANVGYLVPNRLEHGYGLTPQIVDIAAALSPRPELIVTVDNGISSHSGIAEANARGIPVLVTDHHLPDATLPQARLIVNPNSPGCGFRSKALAGCGVMWYVIRALENLLRSRDKHPTPDFRVETLLPILAIGTIADVVPLDQNNRILVREGLRQIRESCALPGISALCEVARLDARMLSTGDVGFLIGPRLNAAGRLESMDAGVECLTTDDPESAVRIARSLDEINQQRREIQAEILEQAVAEVTGAALADRYTVIAAREGWHRGVIGIVAGRVREVTYRPTFIFAPDASGALTGSGRSISGFHLRDALDLVAKRAPGVLLRYGGHAMAAGATVAAGKLSQFTQALEDVARENLRPTDLKQNLETDGALERTEMTLETARMLREEIWGQGFSEPMFCDVFQVIHRQPMGADGKHLRLRVKKGDQIFAAVQFRAHVMSVPDRIRMAYRLNANTFRDETTLQLVVEHWEAA